MNALDDRRWEQVTLQKLIYFCIGLGIFALLVFNSTPGFVFCLDDANLMFHEAGHPAVGLFSDRLMVYGGTMGQLTFPVIVAVSFWRRRDPISFAASIIWFFENWLYIAWYMADARAQVLPLVGGGCHDWHEIFGRWDVLPYDTQIAAVVRTTGWIGMSAASLWVVWLWWVDRKKPAPVNNLGLEKLEAELKAKGF